MWLRTPPGMLLAALSLAAVSAHAASYPTKPVRMVVVYGPGSGPDISIRIYANYLQKRTGQPFVVENKLGAGGIVAIEEDPGSDLAADGFDDSFARGGFELAVQYRFVTALPHVQTTQCVGPRQAAGMRDKNPRGARRHLGTMVAAHSETGARRLIQKRM